MDKILAIAEVRQAVQVSWASETNQIANGLIHLFKYLKGAYHLGIDLVQSDSFYLNTVASVVVFVSNDEA